jgi:glycosyltransferase involved in cell wall biosynthesis
MLEIANGLKERGLSIVCASGKDGVISNRYKELGISVHIVPRAGIFEIRTIASYIKIIKQNKIDLVHLNTLTSYFKYPAIAAALCGVKIVWWTRENILEKRCQRLLVWLKFFARAIVCVSNEQSNYLKSKINGKNIHVIHNGIDVNNYNLNQIERYTSIINQTPGAKICYVGSLEKRKGLHDLIAALGILSNDNFFANLFVFGGNISEPNAYTEGIIELAKNKGILNQVHFLGKVENMRNYYKLFDAFCLPTYWEGCSRAILEAMVEKCAVITTSCSGNVDLIQDGRNGWLFPPGNPAALAKCIKSALSNFDQRVKFSNLAASDIAEKFSSGIHTTKVELLYKLILKTS